MIKWKQKTEKKLRNLKPFKEGYDSRRGHRPKGKRNFKTDFEIAAREIAKALKLGDKPDPIYIELTKRAIHSGLTGNYNFWRDLAERLYGKEPDKVEGTLKENIKVDDKTKEILDQWYQDFKLILKENNGKKD